jgi:hypothetical protein
VFATALLAFQGAADKNLALRTLWNTALKFGKQSAAQHTASPQPSSYTFETVNVHASTHSMTDQTTQTDSPISHIQPSTLSPRFVWADEPLIPIASATKTPRDLSVLSSGSQKPFSTLQRRRKRKRATHQIQATNPCSHQNPFTTVYTTSTQPTAYSAQHCPETTQPSSSRPCLDWDRDPCLVGLRRILEVLGWSRHGFKGVQRGEDAALFAGGTWDSGG